MQHPCHAHRGVGFAPVALVFSVTLGSLVASSHAFLLVPRSAPLTCSSFRQSHRCTVSRKPLAARRVRKGGSNKDQNDDDDDDEEEIPPTEIVEFNPSLYNLDDSLSSQISYFYLQKELGLSEETLWKITENAPSVLGMTAKNIRSKVELLRSTLELSDEEIRILIDRQPTILHLSAQHNVAPTLHWIQSSLEMSTAELRQLILAQPALVTCSVESNLRLKLQFFTRQHDGLGFSVAECRKLLLEEPKLWIAGLEHGLAPRARFFLLELELSKEQLRMAMLKNPRILLCSVEENLVPKLIHHAIMTLHMDPGQVAKLITSYPKFLDYNLDRHIVPLTRYFLTELEVSPSEFRNILLKYPRIVTYSLTKIKHIVGFLRYQIGFDADGVRRVLYQCPQVLGLDPERNLIPKIEFLQQTLFGWSQWSNEMEEIDHDNNQEDPERNEREMEMIRTVILGLPTVFNLSVDKNLAPKVEYLRGVLQTDLQSQSANNNKDESDDADHVQKQLQEILLLMPALFGYSLDNRIRPRMQLIIDAGLPPSIITIGISMKEVAFLQWLMGRKVKKLKQEASQSSPFKTSSLPLLPAAGETQKNDRSGRIVHWTRERKPREP